jgi:protein-disulfide isomerase
MPTSNIPSHLARAFAVAGLAASVGSLYAHVRLLANPSYASFCDISATVSCTQAYSSPYAFVWGVPVAVYGVLWFAFLVLIAFLRAGRPSSNPAAVSTLLFPFSLVGLPVVAYFAYAAFVVLHVVCLMCLATYAAAVGVAACAGAASWTPPGSLARRAVRDARSLVAGIGSFTLVVTYIAGALLVLAFFPRPEGASPLTQQQAAMSPRAFERWYQSLPRVAVPVPADGASVVIVKFTDLQCPSCGSTFFGYRPVLAKYEKTHPGAVKFVVKDFPLQAECNPLVTHSLHTAACDAAVAVRLAADRGRRDALESWLYAHQQTMSPAAVREAAARIAGVDDFDQAYAATISAVKQDVQLGLSMKIGGTPTYFVNGTALPFEQALSPEQFDAAIALELRKAGKM